MDKPAISELLLIIMAIVNPQPPQVDGLTYDLLAVSLAMTTVPRDGQMSLSIAATFTPYREGENGPELLTEGQSVLAYGDALQAASKDQQVALFLARVESAGQAYVNARI